MSQCKQHLDSMWGRCTSCGMTWDEQAKQRDKRGNVSAMVRSVESGERYTIERGGEPVAVVIPYAERERLREAADRLT
jgi:prevent-host-death family protein